MAILIIKSDGKITPNKMPRETAQLYLSKLLENNKQANLKQCLTDVTDGNGKATGGYKFDGKPVRHASSGNGQISVTIFYYVQGEDQYIFAIGEHRGPDSYKITTYGQPGGEFKKGRGIQL
jgi:hypothetical protein